MNVRHLAQLAVIVCLLVGPMLGGPAQHLPEEQQAKGPSEHMLSGINVYSTLFTEAIRRLGAPTDFRVDEILVGPPPAGTVSYVWRKDGVRLEAAAHYYEENGKRIEGELYAVDVWGSRPTISGVGRTGAGLGLGDTIEDVKKHYGARFFKSQNTKGLDHIVVQWSDETNLELDFDRSGRIIHMQLMASIE
jgi:hypothetical protein